MNPGFRKLALLLGFWMLGVIFGAGVVELLWARREVDNGSVRTLVECLAMLLLGTAVFLVLALRKPKPRG
jgi:hypothetical protein